MNSTTRTRHPIGRFFGRLLAVALSVSAVGIANAPAYATVTINQSPLIIKDSLPPNIVLMLDDSGSMTWDVMPDYSILSAAGQTSAEALISSSVNGVYYNPTQDYSPPYKVDETQYPASSFTAASVNGFDATSAKVDLSVYAGGKDNSRQPYLDDDDTPQSSDVTYSIRVAAKDYEPATYTANNCSDYDGKSTKHDGYCYDNSSHGDTASFYDNANNNYYFYRCDSSSHTYSNGICTNPDGDTGTPANACESGDSLSGTYSGYCYSSADNGRQYDFVRTDNQNSYYYYYRCSDETDTFLSDTCYPGYSFFTYTVLNSNGTYTRHYVGNDGDCAAAGLGSDVCDDSADERLKVANWYSYYHTRILMAKSGLMNAFTGLDSTYRLGFGSINENNDAGVNAAGYSNDFGKNIAMVQPFGDGSANTQKAAFWNWLIGESPGGSTPLQSALNAVGKYYQSLQPWLLDPKVEYDNLDDVDSDTNPEYACRQSYTILTTDGFWNGTPPSVDDVDGTKTTVAIKGSNGQSYSYLPATPFADGEVTYADYTYDPTAHCETGDSVVTNESSDYYGQCKPASKSALYQESYINRGGNRKCYSGTGSLVTDSTSPHYQQCVSYFYDYYAATFGCDGTDPLSEDGTSCSGITATPAVAWSNTLADIAMKYWVTDLRGESANEVPTSSADPAFWQHMTTFTLGMGFSPTFDDGSEIDMVKVFNWANGGTAIDNFSWPKPVKDASSTASDLAHAAVNGHGGFYSAKSPQAFSDGLKDALKRASERVGTGASLAANSTQLKTGTVAYQANYYTTSWKGDLKALDVNSGTGAIASTPDWMAANEMPAASDRNIYTYNASGNADGDNYVPFKHEADLSSDEVTALGGSGVAQNVIDFLRGDESKEEKNGGAFRNRTTALGDIVDSQPQYVGAPTANLFQSEVFTGSTAYDSFVTSNLNRGALLFVASNDGMLHAFNAETGAETYAYLPGAVIDSGLKDLSEPAYGLSVSHQYYNDGELVVADVYLTSDNAWHTVLVGTTGRGLAKAVYALDVTDTSNIKFMWERSAADGKSNSNYIGQMIGKPVIAQTANGSWSVLIGNGFNSATDKSALLQFDLDDGALSVHATDSSTSTGLAAPAVWIGDISNGISTVAYAGDSLGRLWSFVLNDGTLEKRTSTGTKLFTAKDASNNAQPITGGMLAGKDAATGNVWVFFGTGRYLSTSDLTDYKTQTWYGLIVQSTTSGLAVTSSDTRTTSLAMREIVAESTGNAAADPPISAARALTQVEDAVSLSGKAGWYIDLTSPLNGAEGERIVTPNIFQGNQLLATSRIPEAVDICNPSGRGWVMSINPFTGTAPTASFFDINSSGAVDSADSFVFNGVTYTNSGIGFSSLPNNPIFVGGIMLVSFDNGSTGSFLTQGSGGALSRVSWRELLNQ